MVSNPNLQNRPFIIKVKPLAVTASANGTTPSPLCKPCNLPIRARNWFEIAGDYFSSTAAISRSCSSTEKTPSMLLTLSALRCRLPAAIFNESLPTHICIHLMDFVRVCVCVIAVIKYWCPAPLRGEPVWADTLGRVCGRKGTDNKQIG